MRTPPHLLADWVITLHRRDFGLLLLPSGPTIVTGVRVYPDGVIQSRGKSRAWVVSQMTEFLAGLGITTNLPTPKRDKS